MLNFSVIFLYINTIIHPQIHIQTYISFQSLYPNFHMPIVFPTPPQDMSAKCAVCQ